MSDKSDLWDIHAIASVTFTRVFYDEEVTKEEAIRRFQNGEFTSYQEVETEDENVIEITAARKY